MSKKISELTKLTNLEGTEVLPSAKNGQNYGIQLSDLKQYTQDITSEIIDNTIETIKPNIINEVLTKTPQTLTEEEKAQVLENLGINSKELFIDLWNRALMYNVDGSLMREPYGKYNSETGFFELNGLTDITYEEALQIYLASIPNYKGTNDLQYVYAGQRGVRTVFPIVNLSSGYAVGINMEKCFFDCASLEVISGKGHYINHSNEHLCFSRTISMFYLCNNLRAINTPVWFTQQPHESTFSYCSKLEKLVISYNSLNGLILNLRYCPKWSYDSIRLSIKDWYSNRTCTITVHPDVYAKLTGDTTNEAAAALTPDELAAWQQLLIDGTAKGWTFATI